MVSSDGMPQVTAEWAVWGKRAVDIGYRVLACSDGSLKPRDFAYLIDRYAHPAGPVSCRSTPWPGYAARSISPWRSTSTPPMLQNGRMSRARQPVRGGGRPRRHVRPRQRHRPPFLFPLRRPGRLRDGIRGDSRRGAGLGACARPRHLRPGHRSATRGFPAATSAKIRELAENVARLLLTTHPVGILGADEVPAADRLAFINLVVSLLPFGLRANFSASTWVSSTAQVLNFRLFFATAACDDGRSIHIRWDRTGLVDVPDTGTEPARLYLGWLRRTGQAAVYLLADQTASLRFTDAEIGQLIGAMPLSPNVDETLEELAGALRADHIATIKETIGRLKRYLAGQSGPAERAAYRQFVIRHGLLEDHPALDPRTEASLYRVLLSLAFDKPLTYASYCEIEDAIGGPTSRMLRKVMIKLRFALHSLVPPPQG